MTDAAGGSGRNKVGPRELPRPGPGRSTPVVVIVVAWLDPGGQAAGLMSWRAGLRGARPWAGR